MEESSLERLSWKIKAGFGLGHVLNDMCASMWFTYLLLFFHKVLSFDNMYAGAIMLIGQLADGFSTVFVGFNSDSGDNFWLCNKVGKRKAWHLVGTLCVLGSFPFIFLSCVGCSMSHEAAQLVYYGAFVVIFQFGWASVQISHLSTITDLAHSQDERTGLTAIRYAMTVLSNILVYLAAWALLKNDSDLIGPNDASAFRNLMLICVTVGSVASVAYHATVSLPANEDVADEQGLLPTRISVLNWLKEVQLYQVAMVYMSTRLFVNLSQAYIPLYLQVSLQLPAKYVATVPLTMFLSGFVTSFAMKKANQALGRKATYIIGGLVGIAGCFWTQFGCLADDPKTETLIFVVAALIGIGGSTMLVTSLSLTAEFIGTDTNSSAFIYGLMSLTDKVSNGLAVMLIQHFIPTNTDTCILCRLYFRDIIFYACGGAAVVGVLSVCSLIPVAIGSRRTQLAVNVSVNDSDDESAERTPLLQENQ